MSSALLYLTAITYCAAAFAFLLHLAGRAQSQNLLRTGVWLIGAGAVLHASHIVVSSMVLQICPIKGIHFALSVTSMLACVAYLIMRVRYRIDAVGVIVAPLAITFLVGSQAAHADKTTSGSLKSAVLPVHVLANL